MSTPRTRRVVEVFADVGCPFTHVGLRRLVEHRDRIGRPEVRLLVRAWPLELVNGTPLDPDLIAEEVDEITAQVAPDLFRGFDPSAFPATSVPALALTGAAYERGDEVGEAVALEVRDLLFERGRDVADPDVLAELATRHGLEPDDDRTAAARVASDLAEGRRRGVVGSPHFFAGDGGFFCPALDISRDDGGHLRITADPAGFDAFVAACFDRPDP